MLTITSKDNIHSKLVKSLLSSRKEREDTGLFVVEGLRITKAALQHGAKLHTLLYTPSFLNKQEEACTQLVQHAQSAFLLDEQLCAKLSDTKTPQGVLAICQRPAQKPPAIEGKQILLVSLQDSGNVGTIIRTAHALGIQQVVLSQDCPDLYAPKLIRATMGGVFAQSICIVQDMLGYIDTLKQQGTAVYATALTPEATCITQTNLTGNCAVAIGNEGNGLPPELISRCSSQVMIPMHSAEVSLNAAVAAGIVMWELAKAR